MGKIVDLDTININDIIQTKQLQDLESIGMMNGDELVLIQNSQSTYKTTIKDLLGWMVKNIDMGNMESGFVFIPKGEDIPAEERLSSKLYLVER